MVAWLVPIRESGALLPQAFIGVYLRKHEARHHVWRLGMALQICAITTTLLAALVLSGVAAGAVVLTALVALSIGRSACSLTIKDMEADVAEKRGTGQAGGHCFNGVRFNDIVCSGAISLLPTSVAKLCGDGIGCRV